MSCLPSWRPLVTVVSLCLSVGKRLGGGPQGAARISSMQVCVVASLNLCLVGYDVRARCWIFGAPYVLRWVRLCRVLIVCVCARCSCACTMFAPEWQHSAAEHGDSRLFHCRPGVGCAQQVHHVHGADTPGSLLSVCRPRRQHIHLAADVGSRVVVVCVVVCVEGPLII